MRHAAALLLLSLPGLAVAADDQSWVGKRVMMKRDGVHLRFIGPDGGLVALSQVQEPVVTVTGQGRGWLGIRQGGREGWFPQYDAVLLEDAPKYFAELIPSQPGDPNYLVRRGSAWLELGKNEAAVSDFTEAIRLRPKFTLAIYGRGLAWHGIKEYGRAIADLTAAIRLDPDAGMFRNRARVWRDMGEDAKAVKDLTEAIRLNPEYVSAYVDRGAIRYAREEYEKAVDDFTEAVRLNPSDARAVDRRGQVWFAKEEYEKAIDDFTEAIRLEPSNARAIDRRGMAWYRQEEYEKAIADFTEAIRLDPKNDHVWSDRAWVRATCTDAKYRDGKQAVEDARKSCELSGWKRAYFLAVLATAYAEDGQYGEAVKWVKKALEDEKFERVYGNLARRQLELYEQEQPYRDE